MNTKLIIWILGILVGTVVVSVLWYFLFAPKTVPQADPQPVTLPSSGTITPVTPSSGESQGGQMAIRTQLGGSVVVRDFLHNGVTIPDAANSGRYLLAGNLGYCLSDPNECQAGSAQNYNIFYNSAQQSFTIELTQEPIGEARGDMEKFLLTTTGITRLQLCSLNYYVGVTIYTNAQFTGKNLGFSFCPGATVLPK